MDNSKDIKYWVGFSLIPGISRVKITQLENYFGSLADAWQAAPGELRQAGLDSGSIKAFTSWQARISPEAEMEKLDHYGVEEYRLKVE